MTTESRSVREIAEECLSDWSGREEYDELYRLARFAVEMAEAAIDKLDCGHAWCKAKEVARIAREGGW